MSIGTRIKELREYGKMSQTKLAALAGVKQSTISDLEVGKSKGTTHLAQIANIFGVSALWLETGRGPARSEELIDEIVQQEANHKLPLPTWIDPDAFKMLTLFHALDDRRKAAAMEYVRTLSEAQRIATNVGEV